MTTQRDTEQHAIEQWLHWHEKATRARVAALCRNHPESTAVFRYHLFEYLRIEPARLSARLWRFWRNRIGDGSRGASVRQCR
jgi:hypothetical protein